MSDTMTTQTPKHVCFTGHRSIDVEHAPLIPFLLDQILRTLISHGAEEFYTGGALGFDTIAAISVLKLKREFPHIRLNLILPCKNQTKLWDESDRDVYDAILSQADSIEYVSESYTSSCMHARNRRLVESSNVCIAYCSHSGGGSAYTMAYALKTEKSVVNLSDFI